MRVILCGLCCAALLVCVASSAAAVLLKNPAPTFTPVQSTAGIAAVTGERDVVSAQTGLDLALEYSLLFGAFGFGVGPSGILELHAGLADGNLVADGQPLESADGTVFGASYRHGFSGAGAFRQGLGVAFHAVTVENDTTETSAFLFDLGYGVSAAVGDASALYGGAAFSALDGTLKPVGGGAGSLDFDEDSRVVAFGGLEFRAGASLAIGLELRLIRETVFGFYIDGMF